MQTFEEQVMNDEQEVDVEVIDDNQALNEPTFKQWLANMVAQNNMMHVILKIADFVDSADSDEEFEDYEGEHDSDVIDLDRFQEDCASCLVRWLDQIISRTKSLPHLLNLARQAENAIDELQESAFALLSIMLYAEKQKTVQQAV